LGTGRDGLLRKICPERVHTRYLLVAGQLLGLK
jgi:hypothetical protein